MITARPAGYSSDHKAGLSPADSGRPCRGIFKDQATVAQRIEHRPSKPRVTGSIPVGCASHEKNFPLASTGNATGNKGNFR
jgi:hypothetical protein